MPERKTPDAHAPFSTVSPPERRLGLIKGVAAASSPYRAKRPPSPIARSSSSSWVLPLLVLGGLWSVAGHGAAGAGIFGVGRSKATEGRTPKEVGVTFKDVGGADEAIAELQEIIQFLKTPEQFARLGGRIPKACCSSARRAPARRCSPRRRPARRASLLRDQRLRVRRDVRRRGRSPRARPVRAGTRGGAGDRFHRRDRRDRPEPRRRRHGWAAATTSASRR